MTLIDGIEWRRIAGGDAPRSSADSGLILEYCRRGRVEWGAAAKRDWLERGEALVCDASAYAELRRSADYLGDALLFRTDSARVVSAGFPCFRLDVEELERRFCESGKPAVVRSEEAIGRAFGRIADGGDAERSELRAEYRRLAVLELLLALKKVDLARESACRESNHSPAQVEKVRDIQRFICGNMDNRFTIDELSDMFGMPATALKLCFKNVFGLPVFAYARRERMNAAAKKLLESDRGILEIAGSVGYNNESKFARAFQDVIGLPPGEYRRRYRRTDAA